MKTIREQVEARRQTKLEGIRRAVKSGRLVVKQMTSEQQAEFPAPAPQREDAGRSVNPRLEGLEAEARYRRERLEIYRAKQYGSGLVTEAGLRLREREYESADQRWRKAQDEAGADQ